MHFRVSLFLPLRGQATPKLCTYSNAAPPQSPPDWHRAPAATCIARRSISLFNHTRTHARAYTNHPFAKPQGGNFVKCIRWRGWAGAASKSDGSESNKNRRCLQRPSPTGAICSVGRYVCLFYSMCAVMLAD